MYENEKTQAVQRSSSAGICAVPDRDTPEVVRAMNDLQCVIDRYDNLVGKLHDRLNCVTTPAPPMCQDANKESGYCTSLASDINRFRCKLRDITDGLEGLYERIEL